MEEDGSVTVPLGESNNHRTKEEIQHITVQVPNDPIQLYLHSMVPLSKKTTRVKRILNARVLASNKENVMNLGHRTTPNVTREHLDHCVKTAFSI